MGPAVLMQAYRWMIDSRVSYNWYWLYARFLCTQHWLNYQFTITTESVKYSSITQDCSIRVFRQWVCPITLQLQYSDTCVFRTPWDQSWLSRCPDFLCQFTFKWALWNHFQESWLWRCPYFQGSWLTGFAVFDLAHVQYTKTLCMLMYSCMEKISPSECKTTKCGNHDTKFEEQYSNRTVACFFCYNLNITDVF